MYCPDKSCRYLLLVNDLHIGYFCYFKNGGARGPFWARLVSVQFLQRAAEAAASGRACQCRLTAIEVASYRELQHPDRSYSLGPAQFDCRDDLGCAAPAGPGPDHRGGRSIERLLSRRWRIITGPWRAQYCANIFLVS